MTTIFNMARDVNGYVAYAPSFAEDSFHTTLAANTPQYFTVPSTFKNWVAVFSFTPGISVWVANNSTPVVPSSSFSSTTSELNPGTRAVMAGDVIGFICAEAVQIGISLYAIP